MKHGAAAASVPLTSNVATPVIPTPATAPPTTITVTDDEDEEAMDGDMTDDGTASVRSQGGGSAPPSRMSATPPASPITPYRPTIQQAAIAPAATFTSSSPLIHQQSPPPLHHQMVSSSMTAGIPSSPLLPSLSASNVHRVLPLTLSPQQHSASQPTAVYNPYAAYAAAAQSMSGFGLPHALFAQQYANAMNLSPAQLPMTSTPNGGIVGVPGIGVMPGMMAWAYQMPPAPGAPAPH
jgi:hypothetical protein